MQKLRMLECKRKRKLKEKQSDEDGQYKPEGLNLTIINIPHQFGVLWRSIFRIHKYESAFPVIHINKCNFREKSSIVKY